MSDPPERTFNVPPETAVPEPDVPDATPPDEIVSTPPDNRLTLLVVVPSNEICPPRDTVMS